MIYPGMFILLFGIALIIYLIFDGASKIFIAVLAVAILIFIAIFWNVAEKYNRKKAEKKHRDFIRKMKDYDRRTYRY
jgi:membrane protein implicated in regulation of membrane protease activity